MRHVRHVLESLESRLLLDSHPVIDFGAEIEPNDTRETATPLPESPIQQLRPCFLDAAGIADCPPTLYNGHGVLGDRESVDNSADVDFWSIRLVAGNSINLRMEGSPASFDVLPELQDANGQVVSRAEAHDHDGDGTTDSATLEFAAETGGAFYIQVGPGGGRYAIHAAVKVEAHDEHDPHVEHEPNDTFETAQEIPLRWREPDVAASLKPHADGSVVWQPREGHGFVRGSLENGEVSPDTDFYQITIEPESTIGVFAAGAGAQGGHLTIYGQDHNIIAEADPNADGNLAARFESTSDGQYFIQLTDTGTVVCITTPCLTYELEITARREFVDPYAEQEPNDTLQTANPMRQVQPPIQIHPIDLDNGKAITVGAQKSTVSGDAVGLRPETNVICLAIGCGGLWWDRPVVYFARGDFSTSDGIHHDFDWFSFEVQPQSEIEIFFDTHVRSGVGLYTGGGSDILVEVSEAGGPFGQQVRIRYFALTGGTYALLVAPLTLNDAIGDTNYELRVTAQPNTNIEHEPNDTLDTANMIELQPAFSWWPCEFDVCPLADANGIAGDPADHGTPREARAADLELRPIRWPEPRTLHGFVEGELENATCPPNMFCIAVVRPGIDHFVFDVPAEQHLSIHLTGPLAESGGILTLLDADGAVLASDADGSDGLGVEWRAMDGGTFYAQVTGANPTIELLASNETPSVETAFYVYPRSYRVDVTTEPLANPVEGPDEHEPNDTVEQANEVELPRVGDVVCLAIGCPPAPLPGEHSRHQVVDGIAGGPTHDVDYFSFHVLAGEQVSVGLGRVLRYELEPQTNIVDPAPDPQSLLFVTVFDSQGNEIGRTEGDTAKPILFESELGGVYFARVELQPNSPAAEVADYALRLHASKFSNEGPDESEPNNTFDEADPIELLSLPTFAPGIELRGGDARGIAGGPSHDQDVFGFKVQAGEHVTVGVTEFGRTLGECLPGFVSNGIACLHADEHLPLFLYDRPIHVTVFDAEGNEVAASDGSDGHPHVVSFEADAAGTYFAVVSVSPDTDGLVRYRLGVLAQLTQEPQETPSGEPPLEVVLRHGQSFRYTDSDGDAVQIVFQGRGGTAHIMFDGSDADGSNIVSVDIAGVRSGGNFRVRTSGSADVGSLEIDGLPGRARRASSYGNVSIDGNLGSFSSSLNLRSLVVDGILGDLSAPGRQIGQVSAMVFDHAMADVGSIRSLQVEEEMSSAIFELFLPEKELP